MVVKIPWFTGCLAVDKVFVREFEVDAIFRACHTGLADVTAIASRSGMLNNRNEQNSLITNLYGCGIVDLRFAGKILDVQ